MRQGSSLVLIALLGVLLPVAPVWAQDAAAPRVGECFDLDDGQLAGTWVEASPVPCDGAHTVQVTSVRAIGVDADPSEAARGACGALGVWNEVGLNRPVAGIVREPLRIEPRAFAVRQPEPVLACGAAVVAWDARGRAAVVPLARSLDAQGPRALVALRHCLDPGATPEQLPAATVPCDRRPRWQVDAWIVGTAFYDAYPGRAVLRAQAKRLCGPQARFAVPTRTTWAAGLPRTWCLSRVA